MRIRRVVEFAQRNRDIALPAGATALAVTAFALLDATGTESAQLGGRRTLPTVLGAAVLAAAAAVAWRSRQQRGNDRTLPLLAGLLGLIAIVQLVSLAEWLRIWTGVRPAWVIAPLLACGVVAAFEGNRHLRGNLPELGLWFSGWSLWAAAQLPALFGDADAQRGAVAGIELLGIGFLGTGLVLGLASVPRPWSASHLTGYARSRAWLAVRRARPGAVAIALLLLIVTFTAIGAVVFVLDREHTPPPEAQNPLEWFDLNAELTFPAYFSAILLWVAAGLALLVGSERIIGGAIPWLLLATIFLIMGVEEMVDVHERLEEVTDRAAQLLMAPLIVAAMGVGLVILKRLWRHPLARNAYVGGAVLWGAALLVDPLRKGNPFPEEQFEMLGSALFVIGMLLAARTAVAGKLLSRDRGLPPERPAPARKA